MSACLSREMDMQGETSHLFYFDGSLFSILSVLGLYLLHRRASFERGGDVCQLCTSTFISINLRLCWDISVRIFSMAFRRYGKQQQQPKFYSFLFFFSVSFSFVGLSAAMHFVHIDIDSLSSQVSVIKSIVYVKAMGFVFALCRQGNGYVLYDWQ